MTQVKRTMAGALGTKRKTLISDTRINTAMRFVLRIIFEFIKDEIDLTTKVN